MPNSGRPLRIALWAVLTGALLLPVGLALRGNHAPASGAPGSALGDYGSVPAFELTERSGRSLDGSELAGSPWFANFIFTRCSGTCPVLSARMAELQKAVGEDALLVSFSVDPLHDSPGVLADYARRFGAKPDRWLFLTGPVREVRRLIAEGFHLSVVQRDGAEGDGAITHSDRIALIDENLRIRAYYVGTEPGWVEAALRDLRTLRLR